MIVHGSVSTALAVIGSGVLRLSDVSPGVLPLGGPSWRQRARQWQRLGVSLLGLAGLAALLSGPLTLARTTVVAMTTSLALTLLPVLSAHVAKRALREPTLIEPPTTTSRTEVWPQTTGRTPGAVWGCLLAAVPWAILTAGLVARHAPAAPATRYAAAFMLLVVLWPVVACTMLLARQRRTPWIWGAAGALALCAWHHLVTS